MKGILFKPELINLILDGDKKTTRRLKTSEKPRYNVGEVVYLKETYAMLGGSICYKGNHPSTHITEWKNKMFMPATASRCHIKITGVRHERLQDISDVDAKAEGFSSITDFAGAWVKINGHESWKLNPEVWVYDFEVVWTKG